MGKINLKGFACLGRYQRFSDESSSSEESLLSPSSSPSGISYNCSHCGHHGTVNAEEYQRKNPVLNNNSTKSTSISSDKFILGKSTSPAVKSVVNDLGHLGKKNHEEKTLMKKLLSFKKEEPLRHKHNEEDIIPPPSSLEVSDEWYRPGFDRDSTLEHLSSLSFGSFIVRRSKSRRDALALSIRAPNRHLSSCGKVAHFLILILPNGFRIKGSKKTFRSLQSLIIHHTVMSEILPCPLVLPSSHRGCGSEVGSESSETEEDDDGSDSQFEDVADISNYPDLLLTLRQTLYATQDLS